MYDVKHNKRYNLTADYDYLFDFITYFITFLKISFIKCSSVFLVMKKRIISIDHKSIIPKKIKFCMFYHYYYYLFLI